MTQEGPERGPEGSKRAPEASKSTLIEPQEAPQNHQIQGWAEQAFSHMPQNRPRTTPPYVAILAQDIQAQALSLRFYNQCRCSSSCSLLCCQPSQALRGVRHRSSAPTARRMMHVLLGSIAAVVSACRKIPHRCPWTRPSHAMLHISIVATFLLVRVALAVAVAT